MIWQTSRFQLDLSRPCIMGIVNVTPDSFSDGGQHASEADALRHCEKLLEDGAHVLDIGGESSRPGAQPLSLDQELQRVLPVVRGAVAMGAAVSVDTYKPQVMQAVLDLGADIINDIWALRQPGAIDVVARHPACGVCLMHMHREPQTMQAEPMHGDVLVQVRDFLRAAASGLRTRGVAAERIVIDPGIGFGKTAQHNLELVARIDELVATGIPVALGVSRKSTLGALCAQADRTPDRPPAPTDRLEAALTMAVWAMAAGVSLIRVHDVAAHVAALGMAFERLNAPNHLQNGLRAG